ncbi:hypothetical protein LGT39_02860 [Demequina sp. TTPB684]|uniref:hypothetical protein n=1 Tax=unclassified Demequina TaxID=2620311 RepID=UPI001CF5128B|nr:MULTISPECIES: hypothetical protein [unclassified Demequina]MCB2411789.1 hypothetical protein [Demequina sp. TTPB684]UPU89018.1 hypothetical protein LGT36_003590 [Demequina sp. TMPB413]
MIVRQGPRATALARSKLGDSVEWNVLEYLVARAVEALEGANWQRAGSKGSRPKQISRPGEKSESTRLGSGALPIHEFNDWWDRGVIKPT